MAVMKGSTRFGIAKESSEGTAITAPHYVFGLESGGINVAVTQEPDDLTSGARSTATVFRGDAEVGAEITCRANLISIGHLLYGALGAVATTGAGDPYTHVFKIADTQPSYTLFQGIVDGAGYDIPRVAGAKVDTLTFEWEGNNPLKVTASYKGRALTFGASFTASATDETALTTNFRPAGGTFTLDIDGDTYAAANIKGGRISITNNLTPDFYSGTLTAGGVSTGWHVAECAFTTVPASIDEWRTLITGTSTGAGVAVSPVYGGFSHIFETSSATAGHQLTIAAGTVAFMCELPPAEAGGGAAEVELAGNILYDASDASTIVATLVNATSAY